MSETLLGAGWEQVSTNLLSIRQSRAWQKEAVSWDIYCKQRWSLSKTRAKLLCNFGKLCVDCRKAYLPVPDSPDNVAPILALTHKRWLETYRICVDYANGAPINAAHCQATMEHFSIIARKRVPDFVLNQKRLQKSVSTIASFGDGEKLVDEIGTNGLGKKWKDGVRVMIEADQFAMDQLGGSEKEKPF